MGSEREKLLDRIRRLLRLAESSNVHEAASAAARAQELMARHRIEAAVLDAEAADPGIVDHRDAPIESSKRLRPWKSRLADVVARANGCRIYLLENGALEDVVLVGRPEDAELVRALYVELRNRVEALTRAHGEGRDRAFCNAFRLGVVDTLAERLAEASRLAEEKALEGGVDAASRDALALAPLALARLHARDEAVDRFLRERLRLRPGRGRSLRADAEGYERGRVAGHGVALGPRRR